MVLTLAKSQKSLKTGVNKNGELNLVNHQVKQVKDIYQVQQ